MSAKQRVGMLALVLTFLSMVAVGVVAVTSPSGRTQQPPVFYEDAPKSLPVLAALAREHVTYLRTQDWCRAFADNRERRATTIGDGCTAPDRAPGAAGYKLFDDATEKRFLELRSTLKALPYDVIWITIEYGSDDRLRRASLQINTTFPPRYDSLTYDPGYALPVDMPGEIVNHRIDRDWYYTWEDWM